MGRMSKLEDFIPSYGYGRTYTKIVRGEQSPRPWNLREEILRFSGPKMALLDVGCGSGGKILELAPHFGRVTAVEPNSALRQAAARAVTDGNVGNVQVIEGEWNALPVEPHSIDVMTSMLSGFYLPDIKLALKSGGTFILESIGPRDQESVKRPFGTDEDGHRGQYLDLDEEGFLSFLEHTLQGLFESVRLFNGFWNTRYRLEEIPLLLASTPLVRNFDAVRDQAVLAAINRANSGSGILKTTQNRVLVVCTGKVETRSRFHKRSRVTGP